MVAQTGWLLSKVEGISGHRGPELDSKAFFAPVSAAKPPRLGEPLFPCAASPRVSSAISSGHMMVCITVILTVSCGEPPFF